MYHIIHVHIGIEDWVPGSSWNSKWQLSVRLYIACSSNATEVLHTFQKVDKILFTNIKFFVHVCNYCNSIKIKYTNRLNNICRCKKLVLKIDGKSMINKCFHLWLRNVFWLQLNVMCYVEYNNCDNQ